jgi:hypothetical protein
MEESVSRGSLTLNAAFDGNFTPIVRQVYDEATEGLERYQ